MLSDALIGDCSPTELSIGIKALMRGPANRYHGKIRGRVRLAEATTWSGAMGFRWSPAGLFFYSTKEATDITRKHIARRHGHTRE